VSDEPVVVIGAGIAGLGAAHRLQRAGCPVVVVEARRRIGGRLHTVTVDGATVDLGGAWIHGPDGNPVTPLAEAAGVTGVITHWHRDPSQLRLVTPEGAPGPDQAAFTRGVAAFWNRLDDAIGHHGRSHPHLSIAEAVGRRLVSDAGLTPDERAGFDHSARVSVQNLEAEDPERVSFAELRVEERPGGDLLLTGGGYGRIVEHLAQGLDVRTDWAVDRVRVSDDGVEVGGPTGRLIGLAAIVTLPLPVLAGPTVHFDPPLPAVVHEAMRCLGMGVAEKLVLAFAERTWSPELASIAVLDADPDDPFASWTVHPVAPVLVSYAGGRRARRFGSRSDADLLAGALASLRRALGTVAEPVATARTTWGADPFSQGSYSYNAGAGATAARERLAEPLGPRLVLAGEATVVEGYGTAHGALASGYRAADQVLAALSR
jgi:polyamine oxidase